MAEGGGACMVRGHAWQEGVWQGVYVAEGRAWQGGVCGRGGVRGIRSMSGRYGSYWNAFLLGNDLVCPNKNRITLSTLNIPENEINKNAFQ